MGSDNLQLACVRKLEVIKCARIAASIALNDEWGINESPCIQCRYKDALAAKKAKPLATPISFTDKTHAKYAMLGKTNTRCSLTS